MIGVFPCPECGKHQIKKYYFDGVKDDVVKCMLCKCVYNKKTGTVFYNATKKKRNYNHFIDLNMINFEWLSLLDIN